METMADHEVRLGVYVVGTHCLESFDREFVNAMALSSQKFGWMATWASFTCLEGRETWKTDRMRLGNGVSLGSERECRCNRHI